MKFKKYVIITLSLLMSLGAMGCHKALPIEDETEVKSNEVNEKGELVPEQGAKLVFWTVDEEYGKAIATAFEAQYSVPVTVEKVGMGEIDKMILTGPTQTGADVFMSSHDNMPTGMAAGLFLEINPQIAERIKAKMNDVGIKTVTVDNKLYGVPVSIETSCLFYNKDLVGETPAITLEEILEKSKTYNDVVNNKFYFLYSTPDTYKAYPLLSAFGYHAFGENGDDNTHPGFETEAFKKGLELIYSLREIMPVSATDLRNAEFVRNLFMEGKVAYEITGPWDIKTFRDSGVHFGVTTLPTYEGRSLTPFAGVKTAHVSAWTEYPIAAQLLAEFLVSDEGASLLYEKANKITTLKDVSNVRGLGEDPLVKPFTQQFENSFPMPNVKDIKAFWTATEKSLISLYDGELTPDEAQKKTIETWEAILASQAE